MADLPAWGFIPSMDEAAAIPGVTTEHNLQSGLHCFSVIYSHLKLPTLHATLPHGFVVTHHAKQV